MYMQSVCFDRLCLHLEGTSAAGSTFSDPADSTVRLKTSAMVRSAFLRATPCLTTSLAQNQSCVMGSSTMVTSTTSLSLMWLVNALISSTMNSLLPIPIMASTCCGSQDLKLFAK